MKSTIKIAAVSAIWWLVGLLAKIGLDRLCEHWLEGAINDILD